MRFKFIFYINKGSCILLYSFLSSHSAISPMEKLLCFSTAVNRAIGICNSVTTLDPGNLRICERSRFTSRGTISILQRFSQKIASVEFFFFFPFATTKCFFSMKHNSLALNRHSNYKNSFKIGRPSYFYTANYNADIVFSP